MQGQPMIVLGEDAERMKDADAQSHNISAARAVAEAVRSTLGPKGMDKMLVSSLGDVTITNDGVTILDEMDIDNPTAEMIVEVADTQEEEAGDGTTTAVAIAGELLKNAEELLDQDIHPTAIINGYDLASEKAREEIDAVATDLDPEDIEILRDVAETCMTGKGSEIDKELLADLVVQAIENVTVEAEDGSSVVDLEYVEIQTHEGKSVSNSHLLEGTIIDEDPAHEDMPTSVTGDVLVLNTPLEVGSAEADTKLNVDDPSQLQKFIEREEEQLRALAEHVMDSGADVVLCQKGIDDLIQHIFAKNGILAAERVKKSKIELMKEVLGARIVSNKDAIDESMLGQGTFTYDDTEEWFVVESEDSHNVTIVLRGTTEHVVDELERGMMDALDIVGAAVADRRVIAGGGAIEVEVARRVRDFADGVSGREQLAVEAFADALELVPRTLAANAGYDPIDTLVDLRSAHEAGDEHAGLDVYTGEVVDTFDAGVIESASAKRHAVSSAVEAANLVLKIDDIITASGLSTEGDGEDGGGPGGPAGPGGMGGTGGMGGMM
ncbi:MAG: thermosome subunit beta [Halococcoides sp.]